MEMCIAMLLVVVGLCEVLTSTHCCVRRAGYDSASSCGNERSQRQNNAGTTERRSPGVHHCTAERPAARHAQGTQGPTAETDNK